MEITWNLDVIISFLLNVIYSLIVLFIAKFFTKGLYSLLLRFSNKETSFLQQYKKSLKTLLNFVIFTIAGFIIISIFYGDIGPFLAGLGIGGIIIAFAVQEPLSNFICGILILINRLIIEGEAVEISGIAGSIEEINLNHVVLKTFDGRTVNLPAKKVWSSEITHFWPGEVRRNEITVGVSYSSDLNKVLEVFNQVFEESETIEKTDATKPAIVFGKYNNSSIDFILRFWAKKQNFFPSSMEIAKLIKVKFAENNIEIPFDQLDIHQK